MRIHFICRGNGLRSTMAEAYIRSLGVPGLKALSSGSNLGRYKGAPISPHALAVLKAQGIDSFAKLRREELTPDRINADDITICLNQRVFDEASRIARLPKNTIVWDVTDLGESPRVPETNEQADQFAAEMFTEITDNLDALLHARSLV